MEAYQNFCSPNNPNCVSGVTCPDCNYNGNGHTEPFLAIRTQLITYRRNPVASVPIAVGDGVGKGAVISYLRAWPNPVRLPVWIDYALTRPATVSVALYDASGRQVANLARGQESAGAHRVQWSGRDAGGGRVPAGIYLYQIRAGAEMSSRKVLVLE